MSFPEDLKCVESREWVETLEDGAVLAGVSDYTQDALGNLVSVNLSEAGDEATEGKPFADVEPVKAISDVYSPVSGTVAEIDEALLDAPESINGTPCGTWFMKMKDITGIAQLMNAAKYEEYVRILD